MSGKSECCCQKCSYIWTTSSKMMKVSCPSCGTKVKNPTFETGDVK